MAGSWSPWSMSPAIQRDLLVPSLPVYLGKKQYLGSKMEHPHGWGT